MENKIFKLFILNHDHALSKVNSSIMVSNYLATKQFSILSLHQSSKDWKGAVMKNPIKVKTLMIEWAQDCKPYYILNWLFKWKKKNQCIELIKMFFYQYIYKCTSAKICYKMEKMKFTMYIK